MVTIRLWDEKNRAEEDWNDQHVNYRTIPGSCWTTMSKRFFFYVTMKVLTRFHTSCFALIQAWRYYFCCHYHQVQSALTRPRVNKNRSFIYWIEILNGKLVDNSALWVIIWGQKQHANADLSVFMCLIKSLISSLLCLSSLLSASISSSIWLKLQVQL